MVSHSIRSSLVSLLGFPPSPSNIFRTTSRAGSQFFSCVKCSPLSGIALPLFSKNRSNRPSSFDPIDLFVRFSEQIPNEESKGCRSTRTAQTPRPRRSGTAASDLRRSRPTSSDGAPPVLRVGQVRGCGRIRPSPYQTDTGQQSRNESGSCRPATSALLREGYGRRGCSAGAGGLPSPRSHLGLIVLRFGVRWLGGRLPRQKRRVA